MEFFLVPCDVNIISDASVWVVAMVTSASEGDFCSRAHFAHSNFCGDYAKRMHTL